MKIKPSTADTQREMILDLRKKLLEAEISMANGNKTYTLEELSKRLEELNEIAQIKKT